MLSTKLNIKHTCVKCGGKFNNHAGHFIKFGNYCGRNDCMTLDQKHAAAHRSEVLRSQCAIFSCSKIAPTKGNGLCWSCDGDYGNCDECDEFVLNDRLINIRSEDFNPLPNEIVPESLYKRYETLCGECYESLIGIKV